MKVKDYICVREPTSAQFTDSVRSWLKQGYELYGPPVMQVSPTLVSSRYGNIAVSGRDTYDFMQVLVKPVVEKQKKPFALLPILGQGVQSCANCGCDPATSVEQRACGRTSS